jgi:uncharacterized protein (TIGR03067 family)
VKLLCLAGILSVTIGVASGVVAQQEQRLEQKIQPTATATDGTESDLTSMLAGSWKEVSYEQSGRAEVMREPIEDELQPVDVFWNLSADKPRYRLTRTVQYGDTEMSEGSFNLGSFRIDTSASPNRITFDNDDFLIPGIFRLDGDDLLIALPYHQWDFALDAMEVGRRPDSFKTVPNDREGGRGYKSPGPTV